MRAQGVENLTDSRGRAAQCGRLLAHCAHHDSQMAGQQILPEPVGMLGTSGVWFHNDNGKSAGLWVMVQVGHMRLGLTAGQFARGVRRLRQPYSSALAT
jgi:hypothetical protein